MFSLISRVFEARKARARENLRRRGYDYAAGRMLQDGIEARTILKQQVQSSKDFGGYNEFDKGIEDAILDFKRLANSMFGAVR